MALDGLPTSGKTTLANLLATQNKVLHLKYDDFKNIKRFWKTSKATRKTLFQNTISAFKNKKVIKYKPYDWGANKLKDCVIIDPKEYSFLIIDGLGVAQFKNIDLKVLVACDIETQLAVLEKRDGDFFRKNKTQWVEKWQLSGISYINRQYKLDKFDKIILGRGLRNFQDMRQKFLRYLLSCTTNSNTCYQSATFRLIQQQRYKKQERRFFD